jgi:hypothetical protein
MFKRTNDFVSVFPNLLDPRIYEIKFPRHVSFLFSVFYFSYHSNVSCDAQNLNLFVTVAPFSRYLSAVIWKVEGNFTHRANYSYCYNFRGLEFM